MAMQSEVGIASAALVHLGRDPVATLEDAGKVEAVILKDRYPAARDRMLRTYPWNFAMRFNSLAGKALPTPRFGMTHVCALPSGGTLGKCLRVWRLENTATKWQVVGRELYVSSAPPVVAAYVVQETNPEVFDPIFAELLAVELAQLCINRIPSGEVRKRSRELDTMRRQLLRDARLHDAIEMSPPELAPSGGSSWLEARRPR